MNLEGELKGVVSMGGGEAYSKQIQYSGFGKGGS